MLAKGWTLNWASRISRHVERYPGIDHHWDKSVKCEEWEFVKRSGVIRACAVNLERYRAAKPGQFSHSVLPTWDQEYNRLMKLLEDH